MSLTEAPEAKPKEGFSSTQGLHLRRDRVRRRAGQHLALPLCRVRRGRRRLHHPVSLRAPLRGHPAALPRLRDRPPLPRIGTALPRRLHRGAEWLGWWRVLICVVIAVYYAAILAWAAKYTLLSFTKGWGDDPEAYFFSDYLQAAAEPGPTFDFVPGILITMVLVWVITIGVLAMGCIPASGTRRSSSFPRSCSPSSSSSSRRSPSTVRWRGSTPSSHLTGAR